MGTWSAIGSSMKDMRSHNILFAIFYFFAIQFSSTLSSQLLHLIRAHIEFGPKNCNHPMIIWLIELAQRAPYRWASEWASVLYTQCSSNSHRHQFIVWSVHRRLCATYNYWTFYTLIFRTTDPFPLHRNNGSDYGNSGNSSSCWESPIHRNSTAQTILSSVQFRWIQLKHFCMKTNVKKQQQ